MFTSLQIKRTHSSDFTSLVSLSQSSIDQLPTAWLLLATDNEVKHIAYNVQKISVSQCTSAYHCQIRNSSPLVVDIAASSAARMSGGKLACRPNCIRKVPRF